MKKTIQKNAVIGYPLGHSKSPFLHNALYKKLGLNAKMVAIEHRDIKFLVQKIKQLNIGLCAITMPFKQSVIKYLNKVDSQAKKTQAVNTVINKKGKLIGYNTDIDGIKFALRSVPIKNKTVLLLGAGGAARAVAFFVSSAKGKILYLSRTKVKALKLQQEFGGIVVSQKDIKSIKFDVIINATPIGMKPLVQFSPLNKVVLSPKQYVFDLVYNPVETQLLKDAKRVGAEIISGVEMFIGQAIRQIELFSGRKVNSESIQNFARKLLLT